MKESLGGFWLCVLGAWLREHYLPFVFLLLLFGAKVSLSEEKMKSVSFVLSPVGVSQELKHFWLPII